MLKEIIETKIEEGKNFQTINVTKDSWVFIEAYDNKNIIIVENFESFFNEDMGFDEEDILKIKNLKTGKIFNAGDYLVVKF